MANAGAKKSAEQRLPGTEDPGIPEIAEAAGKLIDIEGEIKGMKARQKVANAELIAVLKKNDRDHYRHGGIECWIDRGSEKAKAKEVESGDADTSTE